jgi:hypothetical protein
VPTPEPTVTPAPTPTQVTAKSATAQEVYDLALAEASAWQPDAVLTELSTIFLFGPFDAEGKAENWQIVFYSPSANELNTMQFKDGTVTSAGTVPLAAGEARPIAEIDSVILETKSIYDTAAAAGGSQYVAAEYIPWASLTSYPLDITTPTWYIHYVNPESNSPAFTAIIDARSGEVIQAITIEQLADTGASPGTASDVELADPESVLQMVFEAAQTGDFSSLQNLCDPLGENDGDTQMICNLATDDTERDSFIEFFAKGQINGNAQISPDGNEAEVPFLFGPDGQNEETMKLTNRDGQWYLFSF